MKLTETIEITAIANDGPNPALVWMPKGTHQVGAKMLNGGSFDGEISVDEEAFDAIKSSFDELSAEGFRFWLDLDHDDGAAAAWVKDFAWSDKLGIIAHVEWTPLGDSALRNKEFHSFSPAFRIDRQTGRPSGLIPGHAAGGLVNAPAFRSMPSLVACGAAHAAFRSAHPDDLPHIHAAILAGFAALDPDDPADANKLAAFSDMYDGFCKNPFVAEILSNLHDN